MRKRTCEKIVDTEVAEAENTVIYMDSDSQGYFALTLYPLYELNKRARHIVNVCPYISPWRKRVEEK